MPEASFKKAPPKLSYKQRIALGLLHWLCPVKFIFYGGAAGGGKSWMGCWWLMSVAWRFPNTRWFIGRDSLKDTRESVLITFRKVADTYGFTDWKYVDNEIKFSNGSVIVFLDLSFYPQKDPMFQRFGSKEYTGGWIEEAGEVHFRAFDILKSRVGRHLNKEYGIKPKILITANPKKNWIYDTFWLPFKNKRLPPAYAFIRALYTDNPELPEDYVEMINEIKDVVSRERLINGNFDYDDNPNALCTYDKISSIFGGNVVIRNREFFITADIARNGSDLAVLFLWDGFVIIDCITFDKSKTTDIQHAINHWRIVYKIPKMQVIVDEDGVGGGVKDSLGVEGFINNAKPLNNPLTGKPENYANLQSQMCFKLAEFINEHKISVEYEFDGDTVEKIKTELGQLETWKADSDGPLRIKPKDEIKASIGRSPDFRDAMFMRMWFVYKRYKPQGLQKYF